MVTGSVKWFDEKKGFGFIKQDNGGDDVFIHYSGISGKGFKTLAENDRVKFNIVQDSRGLHAVELVKLH